MTPLENALGTKNNMHMRRAASLALVAVLLAGCTRAGRQMNNRGNTAYECQDYAQALTDYRQAAEKLPQAAEPAYNAGNTLYRQEDYAGSLQEMQQALQRAGGELGQHAYFNLGNTLFHGQQLDLAAEAFKRSGCQAQPGAGPAETAGATTAATRAKRPTEAGPGKTGRTIRPKRGETRPTGRDAHTSSDAHRQCRGGAGRSAQT